MGGTERRSIVKIWAVVALGSLSSFVHAANSACPVVISQVKRDTGLGDRITYCFSLNATNTSGKPIASLGLKAAAVDSKHMVHVLPYEYPLADIGAGQIKPGYFSTHRLLGSDYIGVKVWTDRIQFSDKTTWKDDGTHACGSQDIKGGK
jgi:hypothetical protein